MTQLIDGWTDLRQVLAQPKPASSPPPLPAQLPPAAAAARSAQSAKQRALAAKSTSTPALSADGIAAALEPFDLVSIDCYSEAGYPWIEARFRSFVEPGKVDDVGLAIQQQVGAKVLFQGLRPYTMVFLIDIPMRQKGTEPELPASHYGVALDEVADHWNPPGKRKPSRATAELTKPGYAG